MEVNPKTAPTPRDFDILPEEDRATAIGNMNKNLGKNRDCGSGYILADRQTDTHTHTDVHITIPRNRFRRTWKTNYLQVLLIMINMFCLTFYLILIITLIISGLGDMNLHWRLKAMLETFLKDSYSKT